MIYREDFSAEERCLALAVKGERDGLEAAELAVLCGELGVARVTALASRNKILALVAGAIASCADDGSDVEPWSVIAADNRARVESLAKCLRMVVEDLEAIGCRTVLIEGAGVLFGTKMPFSDFCSGDFDVVVGGAGWPEIIAVLQANGFNPDKRKDRKTNRIEFCKKAADGKVEWLNISFLPFDRVWTPLDCRDQTAAWLQRRITSEKDPAVYVLSPEDSLAMVSMHTSLHSFIRSPGIRLHVDVDRLVRFTPVLWEKYLAVVAEMGIQTRAFVSLSMAKGLLGTPIPDHVLRSLFPGPIRWRCIESIVKGDGVFADGRKKLGPLKAVALDCLLHQQGGWNWFTSMIFPPADWLAERFQPPQAAGSSYLSLLLYRILAAARLWRPE